MQVFFARNPDDALRWICRRASHETILRVIEELHEELEREADQERASDQAAISVQVEAAADGGEPEPRGVKRKRALKEKTTRALNKALVDKINLNLAQAVANSQDWENAKAPAGLSNEEQRYRRFATGLSGIGVSAVTQMIAKASAVGTMDVLRDWQAIFAVWKRQNHHGKKLFQTVAVEDAPRNMVVLASPSDQEQDEVGLTAFETENFAYKYFDAQKTHVNGIADDMRHRWKMDGLYEEFERLAKEVKRRNQGTGGRGVAYADQAKDHLFTSTYKKYLGRAATKRTDPELWRAFGDYLDWGKRWNVLKKRFGSIGVFGLLPRSLIPNTFVERTLSQARLSQWADMVAECNPDVMMMAKRIEPLFLACMEESAPPPEFAFLENLALLPQTTRPFTLFLSEQRFEEEESDEGQPNAVPRGDLASIADSLSSTLVGNSLASTPAFQSLA
ncbi:hypothetical protein K504DRAFT_459806 [Pleomassaria siparia CBS 279.74]|uniref:Uncharacterized protein n=1 Tax=Pleomassaria siparia CBS 279.74 TaxID=1314801 RepID=A0A6G1JQ13_9PLEO|nr:hypothetical protein K504DRAFT_459806 [Pleomassaria siparia CBS 279.74]